MKLRKWFFATNVHGMRHAFDQITAAVLSNRKTAGLEPTCLFDDEDGDETTQARALWLEGQGVRVLRHKASMAALLTPHFPDRMAMYGGHWLRCDIPALELEETFVLYTDIDIMFMRALPEVESPAFVACGPEHLRDDYSYFNSGVMIMNLPALRARAEELVETVRRRIPIMAPYDDQSALNEMLKGEWTHLPPEWNWKPYWGPNDAAVIVHFHGPKPDHAEVMRREDPGAFGPEFQTIFERHPAGYDHYLAAFAGLGAEREAQPA